MWHEVTKKAVAADELVVLGIVQEQHAERARLYAQWKGFDFPILQDAMTCNGMAVVPVPVFIDEFGIVRNTRPRPNELQEFLSMKFEKPTTLAEPIDPKDHSIASLAKSAADNTTVASYINLGDAHLLWGSDSRATTAAISVYEKAASLKPSGYIAASLNFRLGVAYRARYDSDLQQSDDFSKAVAHWTAALEANPNQYIWRRRIQQYGPRQTKPYPFYDWVQQAIAEIKKRGETPIELKVPLSGSEVASGQRRFESLPSQLKNPDPENKLFLDPEFIKTRLIVVPSRVKAGDVLRVHVEFEPAAGKWNNEGQPMQVWLNVKDRDAFSQSAFELNNAPTANSTEPRHIEFEYKTPRDAKETIELTGFAVYTVCVDEDGTCRFLRNNFAVKVEVKH